jgi:hypothetical protein
VVIDGVRAAVDSAAGGGSKSIERAEHGQVPEDLPVHPPLPADFLIAICLCHPLITTQTADLTTRKEVPGKTPGGWLVLSKRWRNTKTPCGLQAGAK